MAPGNKAQLMSLCIYTHAVFMESHKGIRNSTGYTCGIDLASSIVLLQRIIVHLITAFLQSE